MTEEYTCTLCKMRARSMPVPNVLCVRFVECKTCGSYEITDEARDELAYSHDESNRAMLSWVTRERSEKKLSHIRICSSGYNRQAGESKGMGIPEIIQSLVPHTISERMDLAIANLAGKSNYFGDWVHIDPKSDYPLLFAQNPEACLFVISHLEESGKLRRDSDRTTERCALTPLGWVRIEELNRLQPDTDRAFIAMWFDESTVEACEQGVKPGIVAAGYYPIRVDQQEFNDKICDQIVAEIRRSRFVVADVTGHRKAVYFEAGFAMGLGLPVIFTCKDGDVEECSFDTRQYNHIVWTSPAELCERLTQRIEATIGRYNPKQQK